MTPTLDDIVLDFARGMEAADAQAPQHRTYQPGIGPHTEPLTVELTMAEMVAAHPDRYGAHQLGVPYGDGTRQKCDLCLGVEPDWEWSIEIKMIRMLGDNGKPNDNLPTHILSPYPKHRSAVTDCEKLLRSGLGRQRAILIYGYEYPDWPLEPMVEAFEVLARVSVNLGVWVMERVEGLIHPVHREGAVFGWALRGPALV